MLDYNQRDADFSWRLMHEYGYRPDVHHVWSGARDIILHCGSTHDLCDAFTIIANAMIGKEAVTFGKRQTA